MSHIRKFNETYKVIKSSDFINPDFMSNGKDIFTRKELIKIDNIFNPEFKTNFFIADAKTGLDVFRSRLYTDIYFIYHVYGKSRSGDKPLLGAHCYTLDKYTDEYYLIYEYSYQLENIYVCDQFHEFEGALKFLIEKNRNESLSNSNNKNESIKMNSEDTHNAICDRKQDIFSRNEIELTSNILISNGYEVTNKHISSVIIGDFIINDNQHTLKVYKFVDEYYLLSFFSNGHFHLQKATYYWCDAIDDFDKTIKKYLKSIKSKKINESMKYNITLDDVMLYLYTISYSGSDYLNKNGIEDVFSALKLDTSEYIICYDYNREKAHEDSKDLLKLINSNEKCLSLFIDKISLIKKDLSSLPNLFDLDDIFLEITEYNKNVDVSYTFFNKDDNFLSIYIECVGSLTSYDSIANDVLLKKQKLEKYFNCESEITYDRFGCRIRIAKLN